MIDRDLPLVDCHDTASIGRAPSLLTISKWLALTAFLVLTGCDGKRVEHDAIVGKWRSNAKLTLKSLQGIDGITPQTRAFLENDFFGHLVIEIQEDRSRTVHEGDDYDSGFEPYEVLEVSDDYVRIKTWSNFFQNYDERILYLEGECYYEIFAEFEFREYFCPHNGDSREVL